MGVRGTGDGAADGIADGVALGVLAAVALGVAAATAVCLGGAAGGDGDARGDAPAVAASTLAAGVAAGTPAEGEQPPRMSVTSTTIRAARRRMLCHLVTSWGRFARLRSLRNGNRLQLPSPVEHYNPVRWQWTNRRAHVEGTEVFMPMAVDGCPHSVDVHACFLFDDMARVLIHTHVISTVSPRSPSLRHKIIKYYEMPAHDGLQ
jgi:hypothetical protein